MSTEDPHRIVIPRVRRPIAIWVHTLAVGSQPHPIPHHLVPPSPPHRRCHSKARGAPTHCLYYGVSRTISLARRAVLCCAVLTELVLGVSRKCLVFWSCFAWCWLVHVLFFRTRMEVTGSTCEAAYRCVCAFHFVVGGVRFPCQFQRPLAKTQRSCFNTSLVITPVVPRLGACARLCESTNLKGAVQPHPLTEAS
jgi:hypothetical protein